jgi:hypothetical protein
MTKIVITFIGLCLISITIVNHSFGQTSKNDSLQYSAAIDNSISSFYKSIGTQSHLYTGFDNEPYDPYIKNNPYFRDTLQFIKGTVNYDGNVYHQVPLLYDIYKDIVISLLLDTISRYDLVTERVHYFDFSNHHFVRISSDSTNLKTGFYDEIYNKKLRVIVRREKNIQTTTNNQHLERFFDKSTSYFLKKGNMYYPVNTEGALMDILKDKKKELKQYLKANRIKFRKGPENALTLLAAHYDHLTN